MRTLLPGLLVAGMLTTQLAVAQQCARPVEKTAFDIAGLKSQLMVTALSCDAREKYNAFVSRYRSELISQERALTGYFGRSFGRRGQQEHDDYVTSLANVQSEADTRQGSAFCQKNIGLFDQVMALPPGTDLPGFAANRGDIVQPITVITCTEPVHVTRTASAAPAVSHRHR
ncbi:MAG: hypothetical protein JO209_09085 [Acidisphaera sp.]|nr:hypothetical protein [Acidisphaera sp.]